MEKLDKVDETSIIKLLIVYTKINSYQKGKFKQVQ